MTSECTAWLIILTLLFFSYILTGCDSVRIEERVVYTEDRSPVQQAKVRQWTDNYKGDTWTNDNGEWTLMVPADMAINLCIENPRDDNKEACFEGILITPPIDGGTKMTKG